MARLILFDIDGTLVLSGRAGVRAMNRAFADLYGPDHASALEFIAIAGRTDRAIVIDAMRAVGVLPTDEAIERLRRAYVGHLRVEITQTPDEHPSLVLPGVLTLLDALDGEAGVVTALLTGNFPEGAEIKLSHFSLWGRFKFGAYGDAHVDRRALVPIALQRAREAGCAAVSADDVIIIGDTPNDIDCAKAHGARAIAVATGSFNQAALRAAGADLTVGTLEQTSDVMDWILN